MKSISTYKKTSEVVSKGHPDKVADTISDAVLDAALINDKNTRVACETMLKNNKVILSGEITCKNDLDYIEIIKDVLSDVGYDFQTCGMGEQHFQVLNLISKQSPDIAQGVNKENPEDQGAGDQGTMYGYACLDNTEKMPEQYKLARNILIKLDKAREDNEFKGLMPDTKALVTIVYGPNNDAFYASSITVACQHRKFVNSDELKEFITNNIVNEVLGKYYNKKRTKTIVNGTGRFILGGPLADAGLTGRKIIVDGGFGVARHGGGAFSGKDPSKVDRSAAYLARNISKTLLEAGIGNYSIDTNLSYTIGLPEPNSITVIIDGESARIGLIGTDDGNGYPINAMEQLVKELFPIRPYQIIEKYKLLCPEEWGNGYHKDVTNYGHFGKPNLPWEKVDESKVKEVQDWLKDHDLEYILRKR